MTVLAVMLLVTCAPAANMTPAQKACCAGMHHDCGKMAIEPSCCPPDSAREESVAASKPAHSLIPTPTLVAILDPLPEPIAATFEPWFGRSLSLESSLGPTYLLVSSLLI
jgi:hypothetical protein